MSSLMGKIRELWTPPEDEYEDNEDDDQKETSMKANGEGGCSGIKDMKVQSDSGSKILNIHAKTQLQVVLLKPENFGEETRTAADELIKMHTVVLNLENTAKEVSRRILDFLSGVAYANNGKIKRIATGTFIITPCNVDLTGDDLLDELESSGVCF